MTILNETLIWFMKRRLPRIQAQRDRPMEFQMQVFHNLIDSAKGTVWGKMYDFASISSVADFQQRVPISTYEELFPYIERVMKGEQNVLWNSTIKWFSKSSGTTNSRSKFIPVSKESLEECHFMGGKDLMTLYIDNKPNTKIFDGKGLSIGGSLTANPLNEDGQTGDVSAVIMKNLPIWAQLIRTPELEIALLSHWEEKIDKMAAITSQENVTSILGVPTWTMVLIERVLEMTGAKSILEIWPNFEVFFHGAVAFQPYRELFKNKIFDSDKVNYFEIYNASEGFFGLQDDLAKPDEMMLMMDYGVFYEFIQVNDLGQEFPKICTVDEVEIDQNYALIISTNAGLWRYKIGDTVRITSKFPLRIKISGRTKHFINAFGEELIVENAEKAITMACDQTGAVILDYTAGPVYMEGGQKGCHEWAIEFIKEPVNNQLFAQILDENLRQLNSDYDAKRYQNMVLEGLKIQTLPKGTFYEWMRRRGKLGGQNKVPRLSNNREYLEEIFELVKELELC
ncbi:MAG: GH3 auxin-responsive promoter family protein [Bacteroidota bacterium]